MSSSPVLEEAAQTAEGALLASFRGESMRARFARGALWSLIGTAISQGLTLVASIVTARMLGREGFGELGIINSTIGMCGVFAGLGLGMTATKYVAEFRTDPARAGRIIALSSAVAAASGGLISIVLFVFAPFLAARTLAAPHLAGALRIGTLLLFFNALNGAQTGALSGFEAFKPIARVNLLRGLLSFPVMVAGVVLWHLPGAIWALALSAAIGWLVNQCALRRECRLARVNIRYSAIWSERRVLWHFSLPAALCSAIVGPVTWAANTILINQPNGYAEMGMFNAANQWRTVIMFLPAVVSQVAMPMMCAVSKDAEPGSANAFRNLLDFAQSLIVALVFPFAVLLMFTATWIMSLYGGAFARGADIVIAVSCAAMLAATGSATGSAIMSQGRVWLGLAINLSWAAVTLTISWFTVPIAGAKALALASAAGYLLTSVWAFAVLAPQLPSGMLRRLYASSAFALLSTVVCFLSPDSIRTLIALPALFVTTCTCAFVFTSPRVRSEIRTTLSLVMSTQFAIHGPRSSRDC